MTRESASPVRAVHGDGIVTGQVDVGATATIILAARDERKSALIVNHGATDVFLGKSDVTATDGCKLPTALVVTTAGAVYGITASGTQRVSFMDLF